MKLSACLFAALLLASAATGCLGGDPGVEETEAPEGAAGPQEPVDSAGTEETVPPEGAAGAQEPVDGGAAPAVAGVQPTVVIAVIDSGINLYHEAFRATGPWPGHPAPGATPVNLTLDATNWDAAVEADWDALTGLQPGTLYTFPGTKVLGAISFSNQASSDWPVILDRPGRYTHGTMTASRAVGTGIAAAGDDPAVGLVLVQGATVEAVAWAASQEWIDVISVSMGLGVTFIPATGNLYRDAVATYDDASHRKPFFASAGNGVGNTKHVGFPTWIRGSSGVPDVISVGAVDNARMTQWGNQDPYVAGDGCANPAARPDSLTAVTNWGGGTSSATPFSAGAGGKLLLEARRLLADAPGTITLNRDLKAPEGAWDSRHGGDAHVVLARGDPVGPEGTPLADGAFTLQEFKDVLYHTALPTPVEDASDGDVCFNALLPPEAVPEDQRFPFMGYGEVNGDSIDDALAVLKGAMVMPERPAADAEYARAHMMKSHLVTAATG